MKEDVFIVIYKKYGSYVYGYLYSLTGHHQTSEDLTQETFTRALSVMQSPRDTIKAWLLTVAHNLYVDYRRKVGRQDLREQDYFQQFGENVLENDVSKREQQRRIQQMIGCLPETQKQVVLLCLVNGLSQKEASKILGISVSSVTNLIYRARKSLRKWRKENE